MYGIEIRWSWLIEKGRWGSLYICRVLGMNIWSVEHIKWVCCYGKCLGLSLSRIHAYLHLITSPLIFKKERRRKILLSTCWLFMLKDLVILYFEFGKGWRLWLFSSPHPDICEIFNFFFLILWLRKVTFWGYVVLAYCTFLNNFLN